MKNVLYIGNNLKKRQSNPSYIEVLGGLLAAEGYTVRYASHYTNPIFRFLHMLFAVVRHRKSSAVVLIDTYSTLNFYYALGVSQLCRLLKLPYVPILHGGNLPERLKSSARLSRFIFKYAFTNVAPSPYLKTAFEAYGYANLTYIPNTLSLADYTFKSRVYDSPKLLWVRSFSELYNPQLAIQVLSSLCAKGIAAELCMVGPDSDGSLEKTQQLAKALNVNVTFTGKLSKAEWIKLSEDYNVFINTTNFDNTPVSVIEAMALGLPIVSTNVGGLPFLIRDRVDGLLVDANNTVAMVEAIEQVFNNAVLRQGLVDHARAKAEGFDWALVKVRWAALFESVG